MDTTSFSIIFQIPIVFSQQQMNLHAAQTKFASKWRRLKYINHLEYGEDMDVCPICRMDDPNMVSNSIFVVTD